MARYCVRLAIAATFLGIISAGTAVAQTADKRATAVGGLEEIVVTATRREERLQDVPISISAFGQEKLDVQGLRGIDDLSRLSPGVTFWRNGFSSTGNYNDEGSDINIRGVDSTAGTSTTAIYIDDTPIQTRHVGFGSINAFPQLFDLDRVELLRGPQGTLFGAGAEGGAVRFIAPEPSLTANSGYYRAEVGSTRGGDASYEGGGAVGGPIIDGVLGFRVSASFRRDGGWVDRVGYNAPANNAPPTCPATGCPTLNKAINWQETATFRAALKWQATENLTVSPSIYYQHLQLNDSAAYWPDFSDRNSDAYRTGNRNTNSSTDPFWIAAVKLDWNLGFAQLISNTAYFRRDQHGVSDYSQYLRATYAYFGWLPDTYPPPGASGIAIFRDVQRNYYQEFRLASTDKSSPFSWTAGVFAAHLSENVPEFIIDPTLNAEIAAFTAGAVQYCTVAIPCPNGLIDNLAEQRFTDKQIAVFGEASYRFTDTLKATLGLRYSKLDYTLSTFQTGPFVAGTINTSDPAYTKATTGSDKPVTPKLVLAWQPDRDNMYYASASKGFRPGTINFDVGNLCQIDLNNLGLATNPSTASSDSLWSYELGGKNTFLDHRLQVNTSVFYIDWKNIQQNVYLPTCGEQFAANLGQATSKGGDISFSYRPVEALTLDFSAAYTEAKLTKTSCAGLLTFNGTVCTGTLNGAPVQAAPVVTKGDRLIGAPWTFTAAAEYHFAEWQGGRPYIRVDYLRTAAQTAILPIQDPLNALHDPTLPGLPVTTNVNLRGGFRVGSLDMSLYALNLTDAHPLAFRARDLYPDYPPPNQSLNDHTYFERGVRPRTIGLTATYRY